MALKIKSNWRVITLILIASLFGLVGAVVNRMSRADTTFQPTAPYYSTFFYPWSQNPNTDSGWSYWGDNGHTPSDNWFSNYLPDVDPNKFDPASELYSSNNDSVIYWQLQKMAEAKMEVAISSWWGQSHKTDQSFSHIIKDVMNRPDNPYPNLRWGLYYEKEGFGNPSVSEIVSDLNHIKNNYGNEPGMLKVNGKPVMFVYGDTADGAEMASRWAQVRSQTGFYVVLKVFNGYKTDTNQPDSWHQYAPAVRSDDQAPYSYMVSPGFWKDGEAVRLGRNMTSFKSAVSSMVNSNAQWKLVQTWNEWGEGTSVEPGDQVLQTKSGKATKDPNGTQFGNAYIDALEEALPPLEAGVGGSNSSGGSGGTGGSSSVFSFAALGDVGKNNRADATLAGIGRDSTNFTLMLGDLDYDETSTDAAWCDYVKTYVGSNYPFQIVTGNHEEQSGPDGYILNHAACLPNRMSNMSGTYPQQYFFDYPETNPSMRVIMVSPDLIIGNLDYQYRQGTSYYNWLATSIDQAKSRGQWVVVGMHKNCITVGEKSCEISQDLMDMLTSKKVDLVLQGHDHNYQRSKQLRCAKAVTFDSSCVVDSDSELTRGAGTVIVINGMGGRCCYDVNPNDSEAGYFANYVGSDAVDRSGYLKVTASQYKLDAAFISTVGSFTDSFSITSSQTPSDNVSPTVYISSPVNNSVLTGSTNINADANDNVAISKVDFYIDGQLKESDNTYPYSYTWNSAELTNGTHTIHAVAFDASGNSTNSSSINVTTNNDTTNPLTKILASEDSWVSANSPDANYGSAPALEVDADPYVKTGYMKFNLSYVTGILEQAKLRMYVADGSSSQHSLKDVASNAWGENTITFNNKPTVGTQIFSKNGGTTGTWVEYDLTSYVATKLGSTFSLAIDTAGADGIDFASSESANPIELVIDMANNQPLNPADLNSDGKVNLLDFSILASNYNTNNVIADINKDGFVNLLDFSILASHYGK